MYQSNIYLEVRVLLSAVPGVFMAETESNGKKDILSVKADFLKKNNSQGKVNSVSIQPAALRKVTTLIRALDGKVEKDAVLERLTGNLQEPPDDRNFTGFSVKAGEGGSLNIMFHQKAKKIQIEEIRIEEDSGHLTRDSKGKTKMDWTYAGCPSMRIRTSADFELGEEAELFLEEFYTLMTYLKLTTPELGENSIRCNAYLGMAEFPEKPAYTVKLRNLNSFNFVRKAINSELSREEEVLSSGGQLFSESRLWIEEKNTTQSWKKRDDSTPKFKAVDGNIIVSVGGEESSYITGIEIPAVRRDRIRSQYGLSRLRSAFICGEKDRADYFEEAVSFGAEPLLSAHWMASELSRILNMSGTSIRMCRLTSSKFAEIMIMLKEQRIHSGMAKTLIQTICKTGESADAIMKRTKMVLLSTKEEIEPYVEKVLSENEKSVQVLKSGDMAPLEYLTGAVMKETGGQAVPATVKAVIKEKLKISIIYMFTMGGAISAKRLPDGTIAAGSSALLKSLLDEENRSFPVQISPLSEMLSEETEPSDWAKLVVEIKKRMESGTANGIVITHGTDTLSYTSALLFWLFSASEVPVVLTASSTLPSDGNEAAVNLNLAVKTAGEMKKGVYVVYGGKVLSPLNLKFWNTRENGFMNWNLEKELFFCDSNISQQFLSVTAPETEILTSLMNEAAGRLQVIHMHPGMQMGRLEKLLNFDIGVDNVILELYGSGTGNMRNSDYSLAPVLQKGRKLGCRFYCTSQQETKVDFSAYSTGAGVWREGAVPMGILTTESVVALYFASYMIADSDAELNELMESAAESLGV